MTKILPIKGILTATKFYIACHPKPFGSELFEFEPQSRGPQGRRLQRRKAILGFTLIELLVVIGILTVLLAIVIVAINPARQFSQANDTQRRSDINAILNGSHQYAADNKGTLPAGIPTGATAAKICKPTATCNGANPAVDLCASLVATYLADIPRDPKNSTITPTSNTLSCDATTTAYDTIYTIIKNASNRVTVCATPEITPPTTLCITR